jgi:hypothetical protein
MSAFKPTQVRINISARTAEALARLEADSPALSKTQWMTLLVDAAAMAVKSADYSFKFPLKLQIVPEPEKVVVSCRK